MTLHSLKPSYIVFAYHSAYGSHKMTLPTRLWEAAKGTHGFGGYEAWNAATVEADSMCNDLATQLIKKFPDTVTFDTFTIYNFDEDAGFFIPRTGGGFTGKVGTDDDAGWTQAVQSIFTFYDTEFNTSKLVLLDTSSRNNFARRSPATMDADEIAIANEYSSLSKAWSSRAGYRHSHMRSISLGINDALKKQYAGI